MSNKVKGPWTRTRFNLYNVPFSSTYTRTLNGTVVTNQTDTAIYSNGDKMTDTVTPGFAQRSASGGIILNPMNKSHTEYSGSDGGWAMKSSNNLDVYNFGGSCVPIRYGFPLSPGSYTQLQNLLTYVQTNALGSVKTSNFMGLVAAAESAKTLRMLANPLGTLASLVRHVSDLRKGGKNLHIDVVNGDLRRINGKLFRVRSSYRGPGKPVQVPKGSIIVPAGDAISGTVLAHNLGLRPLLMDIDAVFHEIPKAHQLERQTFRSTASDSVGGTSATTQVESVFTHNRSTVWTQKVTVRTAIMAGDVFSVAQDFGVSLYDVPEAAWELIPYSFLVDYVLNVGDLLAAQRATQTQKILGSCTTVLTETEAVTTYSGTTSSSTGWVVTKQLAGTYRYANTTKVRTIGLDHIGLAILPRSKILAPSHIQNTLSLIVQQLVGMRTGRSKAFY